MHWVGSWGHARWHTRKVPDQELNLYRGTNARHVLELALNAAMPMIEQGGLVSLNAYDTKDSAIGVLIHGADLAAR